jgi:RNA polymerase sigma-70 factor (ECF subfamily)
VSSSAAIPIAGSPYLRDPDVQLMLRARDGEEAAFSELVVRYQDRLIGLLANMVGSADNAEDLAQDVFLRIYKARNGYQPNAKFSTWLFAVAHNVACNSKRSRVRRKEVQLQSTESTSESTKLQDQLVPDKSGMMPTRQFAKKEMQERVQMAMGSLNERQRMAVLLHKFEGMSYADIGAALEMTPQAVKSLLSRARDNLRLQLEGYVK